MDNLVQAVSEHDAASPQQARLPAKTRPVVALLDLGLSSYSDAHHVQRELHARRKSGAAPDTLILTEHQPVFTLGSGAATSNLLVGPDELRRRGIELVTIERGGDITYHGPGQIVAYPILDLHRFGRDVHLYIRRLEETAMRLLSSYGVAGKRRPSAPGVWVGPRKVASVGVYISRWVTMHGIAINIDMDLAPFTLINPCGFAGLEMTSVAQELGQSLPMADAVQRFLHVFAGVFGCAIRPGHSGHLSERR